MKLLLWDIDGTILYAGHAGERAFDRALQTCFGVEGTMLHLDYQGRTDVYIARMILEHYQIPQTPENVQKFLEAYLEGLRNELPQSPAKTHPGVLEILEQARQRPDLAQGLLTGNLVRGAEIKLGHFDTWHFFEFGAFADDSHIRNELGPFALGRAREKFSREFAPQDVYIIGDTPHDVACAKVIGAHCIAVATGHYNMEQLAACEPLAVLPDLGNPAEFFALLK